MPNYGPETRGDVVLSSDTTFDQQFLSFRSLTVQSGVTMTVPHLSVIFCTSVMEVNGTVEVEFGKAPQDESATTSAKGGNGGGSVNIISFVVDGSGAITANGENGEDGFAASGTDPLVGSAAEIVNETTNLTPAQVGGPTTVGQSIIRVFDLYIENRLLAGTQVTNQSIQQLVAGAGSAGVRNEGGFGGGLGGRGGAGGSGGGNGTGAGGAGGQIVIMTENLEDADLSISAVGGRGGDAPNFSDSAGGGGGGGGVVIFLADKPPEQNTVDVSGGRGGDGDEADGEPGADGIVMRYPVAPY